MEFDIKDLFVADVYHIKYSNIFEGYVADRKKNKTVIVNVVNGRFNDLLDNETNYGYLYNCDFNYYFYRCCCYF